jgi:hypothetical protein
MFPKNKIALTLEIRRWSPEEQEDNSTDRLSVSSSPINGRGATIGVDSEDRNNGMELMVSKSELKAYIDMLTLVHDNLEQ